MLLNDVDDIREFYKSNLDFKSEKMNFHIKHLQRFIEREIAENDLSEVLFQLGHENNFKDGFFELELTPNRGDCLSLMGLARDLNYFFGHNNNLEIFNKDIQELEFNFINNVPDVALIFHSFF